MAADAVAVTHHAIGASSAPGDELAWDGLSVMLFC
jgi:hypothetical protein